MVKKQLEQMLVPHQLERDLEKPEKILAMNPQAHEFRAPEMKEDGVAKISTEGDVNAE